MTHIIAISNGQGAPSTMLLLLARELGATVSITADTGWENDKLWSTGERSTSREYFERVTQPLAQEMGVEAVFVRANDENGNPLPPIPDAQLYPTSIDLPFFGNRGGKLMQSCTGKWKVQAIRQELRRRGATTAVSLLGLTMDEVHRMKESDRKWNSNEYPLIDRGYYRVMCQAELESRNIPYLITTECDGCPHKDPARWLRTNQRTIEQLAIFEGQFRGTFFLTRELIPIDQAVRKYRDADEIQIKMFVDSCDSGYSFT